MCTAGLKLFQFDPCIVGHQHFVGRIGTRMTWFKPAVIYLNQDFHTNKQFFYGFAI